MLNEAQTRNYNRCQKLNLFLGAHQSVYTKYIPFSKEAQTFTANFSLFQEYAYQKNTDGASVTLEQRELKSKIALSAASICSTATVYAEQYNNARLALAVNFTKSEVLRQKDPDVYGLVLGITNTLQPMLADVNFMDYDITATMLNDLMKDATTFRDNINKANVVENGGSIANQRINEVIKQLDKNVKIFDRLIDRFAATHPDFVAGYRINAALESPATRHTRIEGVITDAATGKPIANALVTMVGKNKEAVSDNTGSYSIVGMHSGEYKITVSATGYTTVTTTVQVERSKTATLNIAL